jgi:hypothetical protein
MKTYIITGTADGAQVLHGDHRHHRAPGRSLCRTRLESSGFGQVVIISSKEQE